MAIAADTKSAPISGLSYHENVLTSDILKALHAETYGTLMKPTKWQIGPGGRRVQQYEYAYDYDAKDVPDSKIAPIPPVIQKVITHLQSIGVLAGTVNQVIVNEYQPGQGISPHKDHAKFGDQIASFSTGGAIPMTIADCKQSIEIWLQPNSLLVLSGHARSECTHGIVARKSDLRAGAYILRRTRVSYTFRTFTP